ncbi:MAG: hypothetical protein FJY67_06445 [Calditrichaeota bacterium]|nr:hypothetical protein [Calditrichota bacterium]
MNDPTERTDNIPPRRSGWMILVLIFLAAVSIRIAYWFAASNEAWFRSPGMDPEFYRNWAEAINAGQGGRYLPFPRGPLYPFLLALILNYTGGHWLAPRIFNLLCDFGTLIIIVRMTWRMTHQPFAGYVAGTIVALSGASVYFSGELLGTSLEVLLASLVLLSVVNALDNPKPHYAALSGGVLGLFALARPTALVLLPLLPVAMIFSTGRTLAMIVRRTAWQWGGVVLVLLPVTLSNYIASGTWIPVATTGGVNFYIGNARGATGWSSTLPGADADWTEAEARRLTRSKPSQSDAVSNRIGDAAASRFWIERALQEMRADPGGWVRLMLRKMLMLLNIREIGNNRPLGLAYEAAPNLLPLMYLSVGLLMPFALIGLVTLKWKATAAKTVAILFSALFGLAVVSFFITARYRMPMLPAVAILAGIGLAAIIERSNFIRQPKLLVAFLCGLIVAVPNWVAAPEHPAQRFYAAGNACLRSGDPASALPQFQKAYLIAPEFLKVRVNYGVALLASGDTITAKRLFEEATNLPRTRSEAFNNLGVIVESQGRFNAADSLYGLALSANPDNEEAWHNQANIWLVKGVGFYTTKMLDSAQTYLDRAAERLPSSTQVQMNRAMLFSHRGEFDSARTLLKMITTLHPEFGGAWTMLEYLSSNPPP